jgi:uncharacterized cupin superfamily protein
MTAARCPPAAAFAADVPLRATRTGNPVPFAARVAGRRKRALGDHFGLVNFGVNLTLLAPGTVSSLRHAHASQDEFVYVLEGTPTLITDEGSLLLAPGMCAGFRAGSSNAHHLVNLSAGNVLYLEIGDRSAGDSVCYPDDDLVATTAADGSRCFAHKDGTAFVG